jgi:hypothetical protein
MNPFEPEAGETETAAQRNPKFARVFASYGGARVTSTMRLRADKGEPKTRFGEIIRVHERIKDYTNREQGSLPTDEQMVEFGGHLFETLFQGDVRRLYDEARSRQRTHKLDLVLTSMISWIGEKPWEFAYDTGRLSFLATEEIHFVRNVLTNIPADPIIQSQGPLRILVASAQPVGFGQLSIDQEVEVIRRGFEPLIEAGLVTVEVLPRATPASIHGHLSTGRYSVVHFIGHGVFDEEKKEGCLIFEDDRGGAFPLGERSVREIFCQRGLSLVFLNACQSGAGGRADFNKGIAQALVSHGLPALVANQYSVLDSSAILRAAFPLVAGAGMTLGQSAARADRGELFTERQLIDWAVPVVCTRDGALCTRPATLTPAADHDQRATAAPRQAGGSRRRVGHRRRVSVARSDAGADERGAEGVAFGWSTCRCRSTCGTSSQGQIMPGAERLAKASEQNGGLRANLTPLSPAWLRDDEGLVARVVARHSKPPVVIYSCAGINDLRPKAPPSRARLPT